MFALATLCLGLALPTAQLRISLTERVRLCDVEHHVFALGPVAHTTARNKDYQDVRGRLCVSVTWTADDDAVEGGDAHDADDGDHAGVALHASFLYGDVLHERLAAEAERAVKRE